MNDFLRSNDVRFRLARTIVQGIIAVIIANLDLFIGFLSIPAELKPVLVATIMAILSPVMATIKSAGSEV